MSDAQKEFDAKYISTGEIMKYLGVCRSTVHVARLNGRLGDAISVYGQTNVWEREKVTPYLEAWKLLITTRREVATA